jgi:hypothetical protein
MADKIESVPSVIASLFRLPFLPRQGAMLTGIICAKAAADPNYPIRPRFGILIGAAYPKPFAGDMEAGKVC